MSTPNSTCNAITLHQNSINDSNFILVTSTSEQRHPETFRDRSNDSVEASSFSDNMLGPGVRLGACLPWKILKSEAAKTTVIVPFGRVVD